MNDGIDKFVDLLFNFDMKELENETKFLENYKKLQQENKQLKEVIEEVREYIEKYRYITDKVTDEDSLYYGQDITLYAFNDDNVMELLQILDKVKGE